jgi:hypothetical protein
MWVATKFLVKGTLPSLRRAMPEELNPLEVED